METDTPMIGCLCLWCGHQGSCSPCILKQSVLKEGHGHWIPAFTHIFTPTVSVSLDVWLIKGSHILDGRIARILWSSHSAISYRDRRKGMTPPLPPSPSNECERRSWLLSYCGGWAPCCRHSPGRMLKLACFSPLKWLCFSWPSKIQGGESRLSGIDKFPVRGQKRPSLGSVW